MSGRLCANAARSNHWQRGEIGSKLTLEDGSEITGDNLEETFAKLREQKRDARQVPQVTDKVKPRRSVTVGREGNRIG